MALLLMALIVSVAAGGSVPAAVTGERVSTVPSSTRSVFAGDSACLACHQTISRGYLHTAHHLTSQTANEASIAGVSRGAFEPGDAMLNIAGGLLSAEVPALAFSMSRRDGRFFETAISGFEPDLHLRTESMDVVTGSGRRGQTYLFWQGERLFELPVSYWTEGSRWINSPGYQDGTADFARPVQPGCLECHASYIQTMSNDPTSNSYLRESLVPGISCETCHGPGLKHGFQMKSNPKRSPGEDLMILNPAHFTRDRQVDLCALCHQGIDRRPLAPAFSYLPGRPLSEFFRPLEVKPTEHPDVHGNQVGLLERSRCFTRSATMTCSTCHDTHNPELTLASYSAKCMTCHARESCGEAKVLGAKIADDCINCHMPSESTNVIVSETAGVETRARMRTHWIRIYSEGTSR